MKHRPIAVRIRNATLIATLGLAAGLLPAAHAANKPTGKPSADKAADAVGGPLPANGVARVNNVVITQDQLDQAVRALNVPDTPALRASVKNQLIARELFRQAAEAAMHGAQPQSQNAFKIPLAKRCITHALTLATA